MNIGFQVFSNNLKKIDFLVVAKHQQPLMGETGMSSKLIT